jgi:phage terminase small subunit
MLAPKPRPEVAMRQAARAMLKNILTEFGLTPASVAKVSVSKGETDDPFAEFG